MENNDLPRPENFHVFQQENTWFLAMEVVGFNIDKGTALALRRYKAGQPPMDEYEWKRLADVGRFIAKYSQRMSQVKPLQALEDISEKVTGLYLFFCQDCNLCRSYCYGEEGEYGKRRGMNEETLRQAFNNYYEMCNSKHFLILFGGESLMNFSTLRRTAEMCHVRCESWRAGFSLGITINNTLYNEQIRNLLQEQIDNVTFCLDNPQDNNHGQRISEAGHNVYQTTEKNIRKLAEEGPFNWAFRSIITSQSRDQTEEILNHLDTFGSGGIRLVDVDLPKGHPLRVNVDQYERLLSQIIAVNCKRLQSFLNGEQVVAFEYPLYILFYLIFCNFCLHMKTVAMTMLPELIRVMKDPQQRYWLKSCLAKSTSYRFSTTTWTEFNDAQSGPYHPR
jgi:uncharacterized protein